MSELARLPRFEVRSGNIGFQTETSLDGRPLTGIRDIRVHFGLDEPNTVELEFLAEAIDLGAEAKVRYSVAVVHPLSGKVVGHGASPEDALEDVLRQWRMAP